jgi:hypothetical protein
MRQRATEIPLAGWVLIALVVLAIVAGFAYTFYKTR